jgi:hypothetical protein
MTLALKGPLACLYLAFPETLEEEIIDHCHETPDLPGFTIVTAAGFGRGAKLHSDSETVLGRARRRLPLVVAAPPVLQNLISSLREALPTPDVAYWIIPVAEFGWLL